MGDVTRLHGSPHEQTLRLLPWYNNGTLPRDEAALVERHLQSYFAVQPDGVPPAGLYDRVLEEIEAPLIRLTLGATRGNQVRAAEILGLNRNTLRKKINDLGIEGMRPKR